MNEHNITIDHRPELPSSTPATADDDDQNEPHEPLLPTSESRTSQDLQISSLTEGRSKTGLLRYTRDASILRWMKGPSTPRPSAIQPVFPKWQHAPINFVSRLFSGKTGEPLVLVVLCSIWVVIFGGVLLFLNGSSTGSSANQAIRLECTTRLWANTTYCGLDGKRCGPFEGSSFNFDCPSDCTSARLLEPYTIGDQEFNYRNLVVGGPSGSDQPGLAVYRGDSFICPAAIHAGIISNRFGGCGKLIREGEHSHFQASTRNAITSMGFSSSFPLSVSFATSDVNCYDLEWLLFFISFVITVLISLVSTSAGGFFSTVFVIVFLQTGLVTDPPYFPDFSSVISMTFERFLPAAFTALVMYRYCVRRTLTGLTAQIEKTVLWLGGCWLGALNRYTFDKLPISRLTSHDIQQQPGALVVLLVIVGIIGLAAIGQVIAFRNEGRLLKYSAFYGVSAFAITSIALMPGLVLRLHHYIFALGLLPGTSLQTRPSLLYQGLLFGLFISGVARWGFASILQTPADLLAGGQLGSALPHITVTELSSDFISFVISNLSDGFDGLSILVNDVERFQQPHIDVPATFNWTRSTSDESTFFRFAFTGTNPVGTLWYGDYTKAGVLFLNGTWRDMPPGPSR